MSSVEAGTNSFHCSALSFKTKSLSLAFSLKESPSSLTLVLFIIFHSLSNSVVTTFSLSHL
jgi:hypothetical protein